MTVGVGIVEAEEVAVVEAVGVVEVAVGIVETVEETYEHAVP